MTGGSRSQKTALIVGASRGLGLALTERLWSRGWHVIATRRGSAPGLEALAMRSGGTILLESADIAVLEDVRLLRDGLTGRTLDLLLVNAGISIGKDDTLLHGRRTRFRFDDGDQRVLPIRVAESLASFVRPGGMIASSCRPSLPA